MNNISTNRIIKILPNILISDNIYIEEKILEENNIKNIILINIEDNINFDSKYNIININNFDSLNFDYINNIFINFIKLNENILILSNINIGFIIVCGFIIKYLNLSLIETISLSKLYNINLNIIPNHYIVELFEYYKKINII